MTGVMRQMWLDRLAHWRWDISLVLTYWAFFQVSSMYSSCLDLYYIRHNRICLTTPSATIAVDADTANPMRRPRPRLPSIPLSYLSPLSTCPHPPCRKFAGFPSHHDTDNTTPAFASARPLPPFLFPRPRSNPSPGMKHKHRNPRGLYLLVNRSVVFMIM
jgi:hypothetical protein